MMLKIYSWPLQDKLQYILKYIKKENIFKTFNIILHASLNCIFDQNRWSPSEQKRPTLKYL